MKIQLLIMCYNSSDTIIQTIKSYQEQVDRTMIFIDRKTNDNTEELINKANFKNLEINHFTFIDFQQARNHCLDIAQDNKYTWTIFVDDSYELIKFSREELINVPKNCKCLGVKITKNSGITYTSKRIVKTSEKIRFKYKIHEVFDAPCDYLLKDFVINDITCKNHIIRSTIRSKEDLKMLPEKEDFRSAYYRSNINFQMYLAGNQTIDNVIKLYEKALTYPTNDNESVFTCLSMLGNIYTMTEQKKLAIAKYLKASIIYPFRSGECYLYIYLLSNSEFYIKKAYENRFVGPYRLVCDTSIYSNNSNFGTIEQQYLIYLKSLVLKDILVSTIEI